MSTLQYTDFYYNPIVSLKKNLSDGRFTILIPPQYEMRSLLERWFLIVSVPASHGVQRNLLTSLNLVLKHTVKKGDIHSHSSIWLFSIK